MADFYDLEKVADEVYWGKSDFYPEIIGIEITFLASVFPDDDRVFKGFVLPTEGFVGTFPYGCTVYFPKMAIGEKTPDRPSWYDFDDLLEQRARDDGSIERLRLYPVSLQEVFDEESRPEPS